MCLHLLVAEERVGSWLSDRVCVLQWPRLGSGGCPGKNVLHPFLTRRRHTNHVCVR